MQRVKCPCCGYTTLEERASYEVCLLCDWEDDGQDNPYSDEVWGGPNGEYSLSKARDNFKKYFTMYDEKKSSQREKIIETKKSLISAYEKLGKGEIATAEIWIEIKLYERALEALKEG